MAIRRMRGFLPWLPIEEIKGCPNIVTSYSEIRRIWREAKENTPPGEDTPRQYYCVFCGRPMKSMQAIFRHMGHCQKRKAYKKAMDEGITFTVGSKTYTIKTKRFKVLRAALKYEKLLNDYIKTGEFGAREAEMMFFFLFKGVSLARGERFINYDIDRVDLDQMMQEDVETEDDEPGDDELGVEITDVSHIP